MYLADVQAGGRKQDGFVTRCTSSKYNLLRLRTVQLEIIFLFVFLGVVVALVQRHVVQRTNSLQDDGRNVRPSDIQPSQPPKLTLQRPNAHSVTDLPLLCTYL